MICDIAEVRAGSANFPDGNIKKVVPQADDCICIIGSGRTIYVQLTDKLNYGKTRDWILRVLPCLAESTLSPADATTRGRFKGFRLFRPIQDLMRASVKDDAELLSALLLKGVVVTEVFLGTEIVKTMYLSWKKRRIYIGRKPVLDIDFFGNKGFQVDDIAEIRRGRILPQIDKKFKFRSPDQVILLSYF